MNKTARALGTLTAGLIGITAFAGAAGAKTDDSLRNRLGFIPLTDAPQTCDQAGIEWSPSVTANVAMKAGDAATPTANALPTQTTVPAENDMIAVDPTGRFLFTVAETGSNGALTRLDRKTQQKTILSQRADWNRLDPVKWYAPSNMLLIGEEDGANGSVFQVDPKTGAATELTWLGKMSHEGIAFGSDGSIWEGDENHTGAIYKGVPNDVHDLTAGGTLWALKDGIGFVPVAPATAIGDAFNQGATLFDRPEDFDQRDGHVYFTVTEPPDDATASSTPGHPVNPGGVYAVNDTKTPHVTQLVAVNDPGTGALGQQTPGLQFPDNLAFDRKGNLFIHEDIPDDTAATPTNKHSKQYQNMQDELWVLLLDGAHGQKGDGLYKFANMGNSPNASPCQNEWTGGLFADGDTFFVNQQHADSITWMVDLGRGRDLHGDDTR